MAFVENLKLFHLHNFKAIRIDDLSKNIKEYLTEDQQKRIYPAQPVSLNKWYVCQSSDDCVILNEWDYVVIDGNDFMGVPAHVLKWMIDNESDKRLTDYDYSLDD